MRSSFLKVRYLFLLQSQSIGAGTFAFQYVLHTLPCSLLILNIFFSFSFQILFYLSINHLLHGFQSSFSFFFPRRKEVVVLILFTAVRGDGTLMGLIKLFSYTPTLSYSFHILYFAVLKLNLYKR